MGVVNILNPFSDKKGHHFVVPGLGWVYHILRLYGAKNQ